MPKTLLGAVVSIDGIDAIYLFTAPGATQTLRKTGGWPTEALSIAADLLAAFADAAGGLGAVRSVQVYTALTNPDPGDGLSPGDLLDVTVAGSSGPVVLRVGDQQPVPPALAAARHAFRSAVADPEIGPSRAAAPVSAARLDSSRSAP